MIRDDHGTAGADSRAQGCRCGDVRCQPRRDETILLHDLAGGEDHVVAVVSTIDIPQQIPSLNMVPCAVPSTEAEVGVLGNFAAGE